MTDKAVITRREAARDPLAREPLAAQDADALDVEVEHQTRAGALATVTDEQVEALQERGYRVKVLRDVNLLHLGAYTVDVEDEPPTLPAGLTVPAELRDRWLHHIVHLIGLPTPEWTDALEGVGLEVVAPVSPTALFVVGDPGSVERAGTLEFVDWHGLVEPAYRIAPRLDEVLAEAQGWLTHVKVGVYPPELADEAWQAVHDAGGEVVESGDPDVAERDGDAVLAVALDAERVPEVARHPAVRWLDYEPPDELEDERSAQIVAERFDGAAPPNTAPVPGYQNTLADLGLTGQGVRIGVVDSGLDTHNAATIHGDFAGRFAFFVDTTGGATPVDRNGHGTHVAGIAAGDGAAGGTDHGNFLVGQGVAPEATIGSVNAITPQSTPTSITFRTQAVAQQGADVMNNSWGSSAGAGYTARAADVDRRVRDPDPDTAALGGLVIVFSAGNSGSGASTITDPKEAKNAIVVGNSHNSRPGEGDIDDVRGLRTSSSRGPALDGRTLPTVVAPGTDIVSARPDTDADPGTPGIQRPRTAYTDLDSTTHEDHFSTSGTSMAAPHVAGVCALLVEWWRKRTDGHVPSAAMVKALLVSGAVDCQGGPRGVGGQVIQAIPNNDQGWGRVSLPNIVLQAPDSDRGPRLFSDQRNAFDATGQEYILRVAPVDAERPLRITLVWSDAPGAANQNPAIVNDLDLEVLEEATGNIYRGNVFADGLSVPGGTFDTLNTAECVYVGQPGGVYEVRVVAGNIVANARPPFDNAPWQDFTLALENAEVPASFPVSVVPVIDRSGSMVFYGYETVTRTSSRQFLDLLSVDDHTGVVSFGSTGQIEFPTAPSGDLAQVTGQPTRDAAKAAVDAMSFSGCTFMGAGIERANDLLAGASTPRAMVLLSDGYDNKGCQPNDPSRPSALDAIGALPPDLVVHTCAMGPTSDQELLEDVAQATGGRYTYMPTIDDLFELYNVIRGQVSGDALVANASATASSRRVPAVVDACAEEATFTVAWGDRSLRRVAREPRRDGEISVRLRDPGGRLLHPSASHVRTTDGQGYVNLRVSDPRPGRWYVQVETTRRQHTRFTAGAFVRSDLRLAVEVRGRPRAGLPLTVTAQVLHGDQPERSVTGSVRVTRPRDSLAALQQRYARELQEIDPPRQLVDDGVPDDLARLSALREVIAERDGRDLFAHVSRRLRLSAAPSPRPPWPPSPDEPPTPVLRLGSQRARPEAPTPIASRPVVGPPAVQPPVVAPPIVVPPIGVPPFTGRPGQLLGVVRDTRVPGSYNFTVEVNGLATSCGSRFARTDLVSVRLR